MELGGRAFDVLVVLIEANGTVISKDELMRRVSPGRIVEDNWSSPMSGISASRDHPNSKREGWHSPFQ
jgi:DNA-binding response OmpR family regulator